MYICEKCNRKFKNKENLSFHKKYCDNTPLWILELDDDGKLKSKYRNKKVNAKKENLICNLTFYEFCELMKNANIKSSDLGFNSSKKYVLARYNDTGNYDLDNCRFITQKENVNEKHISSLSRNQSSLNMQKYNKSVCREKGTEEYYNWLEKFQNSDYIKKIKNNSFNKKQKDIRYCKENNSQFGTFWITNGINNLKWKKDKGEIPVGYYKGRTL